MSWHDAQHGLAGADDARTVGAHHHGALVPGVAHQVALDPHHVLGGDAVGDDARAAQAGIGRFHQGVCRVGRGDEGEARLGTGGGHGFLDGVKDGALQMFLPALAGGDATHDVGAVMDHFPGVKSGLVAGKTLHDHARAFIDENAHESRPPRAAATAFSAASASVLALMMGRPLSSTIFWPASTLVPARRTMSGTLRSRAACTTPSATQSQRLIPAKMLTRMAFTFLSESTRRKASATRSGEAPPPTSRKLAGSPPAYLIMSMVAMASPAPLMMQPMS